MTSISQKFWRSLQLALRGRTFSQGGLNLSTLLNIARDHHLFISHSDTRNIVENKLLSILPQLQMRYSRHNSLIICEITLCLEKQIDIQRLLKKNIHAAINIFLRAIITPDIQIISYFQRETQIHENIELQIRLANFMLNVEFVRLLTVYMLKELSCPIILPNLLEYVCRVNCVELLESYVNMYAYSSQELMEICIIYRSFECLQILLRNKDDYTFVKNLAKESQDLELSYWLKENYEK